MFSEDDKKVLDYFFTNLDKPVFATKHMHPEVWALMQARYSRTTEGVRESFLRLLKEDTNNFEILKSEIEKIHCGLEAEHATSKAIQFMEKWVLGYGHSSVAEGAVIGLCLEGISILATKVVEDNRLCSFIEKSTRYVSFNNSSFYIDRDLENSEFSDEIKSLFQLLFSVYTELHEPVLKYVESVVPLAASMNEAAWRRSCAARRFDAIRYLLPAATKTSLGWTVNARQLAHAIKKLLSHQLNEMRELGLLIKEESSKVLPSLLKYADKSEYIEKTESEMKHLADGIKIENIPAEPVSLVSFSEDAEDKIIASILYKYRREPYAKVFEKVKSMEKQEKEKIFDYYFKNLGKFDAPLRELEHEQFVFDIIIDYGAFRDLQRHRICTQTNQLFTSDLGYDVPDDIKNSGMEEKYRFAMEKAKALYEKIRIKYPLHSQYVLPLGFKKRYLLTMNLREICHFVKIRTTPMAHESYRRIAYLVYEKFREKFPLLAKHIECSYEREELGRLKSEERTEAKKSLI